MALLELRSVSRVFGPPDARVHALREVTLTVQRGDFLAIVGPSGGGKSTLLSVIGALDAPTDGEYLLEGVPVPPREGRERASLRARTFGFIFQGFHLLEQRPAIDSVTLGLLYRGVRAPRRAELARAAAEQVGLADRLGTRTAFLSGGQRQRMAIARAIAVDAPVILADEPTGNLDSVAGARVMAELQRLHRAGATVIVVTHAADVAALASRRVTIIDGRLTEDPTTAPPATPEPPASDLEDLPLPSGARAHRPRVRVGDIARDAVASLRSRARQSSALGITIALTIALLVTTLGLDTTARAQVSAAFDEHANREVTASWAAGEDAPADAPNDAVPRAMALAGVESAALVTDHPQVAVSSGAEPRTVTLLSTSGDVAAAARADVRWAGEAELRSGEALIGEALARQLSLGPLVARPNIEVAGSAYTVVGVIASSARAPALTGAVAVATGDEPTGITPGRHTLFVVTTTGAAPQVGHQLSLALDPFDPAAYDVHVPADPRSLRDEVETGVRATLSAFTGFSALVAVLALMNALGAAVSARRPELGLRRALGARSGQLAGLVLAEAVILGAAGGVVGLVAGMGAILTVTVAQRWAPVFDVRLAPLAVVAGVAIAGLSAVIGAVRAARVSPAESLRS